MKQQIINGKVLTPSGWVENGSVLVDGNKILEVSSFMLENINYLKYKYNIVSNVYPTHLEHHKPLLII